MRSIVNYSSGWYVKGQGRLAQACLNHSIPLFLTNDQTPHLTPHSTIPYAFKPESLALCHTATGATSLLWLDSSCFPQTPHLSPIWHLIESQGYYLQADGWTNAQWCNDASLSHFGYTRDQAAAQTQVYACVFGLSLAHEIGRHLLTTLLTLRPLFRGSHTNPPPHRPESADPRCLGHRHDQSILSLLAAKHCLQLTHAVDCNFLTLSPQNKTALIAAYPPPL